MLPCLKRAGVRVWVIAHPWDAHATTDSGECDQHDCLMSGYTHIDHSQLVFPVYSVIPGWMVDLASLKHFFCGCSRDCFSLLKMGASLGGTAPEWQKPHGKWSGEDMRGQPVRRLAADKTNGFKILSIKVSENMMMTSIPEDDMEEEVVDILHDIHHPYCPQHPCETP